MDMSAAAMIIEEPSRNQPAPDADDFIAWRQNLEAFCASMGCRAQLGHVDENRWLHWFTMGQDAPSAVMVELAEVAD